MEPIGGGVRRALPATGVRLNSGMLFVHVHVRVLPDHVPDFIAATRRNAEASRLEPGIARFDLLQSVEDPTAFELIEVYRDDDAPVRHKETPHYRAWRDAVAPWMAEPRRSHRYREVGTGVGA